MKAISYAIANNVAASTKLIESGGLKYVFPVFLGRGLPEDMEKKKINHPDRLELDRASISTISQLCLNLTASPSHETEVGLDKGKIDESLQRLLGKFVENEYEKVDRTVELYLKYNEQVSRVEDEITSLINNGEEWDEDDILGKVSQSN